MWTTCLLRRFLLGGLRRQGPAQLTDTRAVRVSADNRPLPPVRCVLPYSDVYRCSGRTCDSRLPRNRTIASRRHHTLARPWDGSAEEAVEKHLHSACLDD